MELSLFKVVHHQLLVLVEQLALSQVLVEQHPEARGLAAELRAVALTIERGGAARPAASTETGDSRGAALPRATAREMVGHTE